MAGSEKQRKEWKEFKDNLYVYTYSINNDYERLFIHTTDGMHTQIRKKEYA